MRNDEQLKKDIQDKFDFQNDLAIDPMALDCEWLDQPQRFMKYAEAASEASKRREQLKDQLNLLKSQLDQEIRASATLNGEKITEAVVSSRIAQNVQYQNQNQMLIQAEYDLELMQYAVRAMDQRKVALENLVRLFGMEYFSGPKEPQNIGERYGSWVNKKGTRDKIKEQMRRSYKRAQS